ncbi:MAG TPA: phosphoenolpyruvate--protein phosphotransferase [Acholeplasmataceae bacterium]|nr:phosphoenolpyruvate--protein phosphotransferase [Acholeplasmataceae bacterium]
MKLKGIGISKGIAIAKLHHFKPKSLTSFKTYATNQQEEVKRFESALKKGDAQLEKLVMQAKERIGEEHAQIFSAQQMMLKDPELSKNVLVKINDFNLSAPYAFKQAMSEMIAQFELSENVYILERISDLEDITDRILNILLGQDDMRYTFDEPVILLAIDLLPSETMHLDTKYIQGIITEKGSKTSHTAILARNLGIPAVTGLDISSLESGKVAILDGGSGIVYANPDENTFIKYQEKQQKLLNLQSLYKEIKDDPAKTNDGHEVYLAANIGVISDLKEALDANAFGIGLLRTENQYLESDDFPTEDELLNFYLKVSDTFKGKTVTIRTLDIGGDKNLSYLNIRKETNPFLGNRAIRYSLSYPSLFKTQLRAILKANTHNNIQMMFPMISTLKELLDAKDILNETYEEIIKEGNQISYPKIGMMVEVPSVAVGIEKFLPYLDFISIGTNDLIQYFFAADRMNERVAHLYQPYNPIFLNTLKSIIDKANKHGIIVSVCGEMAGHFAQSLLLIGMGVKHLSMHSNLILENKYLISKTNYHDLQNIVEEALVLDHYDEVENLLNNYIKGLD